VDYSDKSEFSKLVFAELGQVIEWGFGILNIGLGRMGSLKIGKSSLF